MKKKHTRSRRASRRHRSKVRRPLCAEVSVARDFVSIDAAVMFTDSPMCSRAAVWLEPQTDEERACSTSF